MISIVVITMNNPDELYSTLGSISNILSYPSCLPIIVHIIDSSHIPTDLPKYAFPVDYLHTKPQGIYHAMNLGLLQSFEFSSEFVWFLNSGCMAFDPLESSALFNTLGSKYDIFFFSYRTSLPRASIVKPHNFLPLIPRQPTNHQSIIYKTDFLKQNNLLYQASLSISADLHLYLSALSCSPSLFYSDLVLSRGIDNLGISNTKPILRAYEYIYIIFSIVSTSPSLLLALPDAFYDLAKQIFKVFVLRPFFVFSR